MTESDFDPTAYDLGGDPDLTDPRIRRLNAWSNHGGRRRVNMPFMTQVADNLWHGGVESGLILPEFIEFKLSLFRWQEYEVRHQLRDSLTVEMYDSEDQDFDQIEGLAEWVDIRRAHGPVLVHCQAGLNRSSLVVAKALLLSGEVTSGQEAIDLIREKRDPACLCNAAFEAYVQGLSTVTKEAHDDDD